MDRSPMIDHERLASNLSTETYQPHYGHAIADQPIDTGYSAGVISVIKRGPTGIGASYAMTEPVGDHWHEVHGAEPLVSRPVGA